jgi:hypothetical protein
MRDPNNSRQHRERTDRNLLLGFFALLFIVGGGLIAVLYGSGAAAMGVGCMAAGAVLAGVVVLVMLGIQWLSDWLERREMGE